MSALFNAKRILYPNGKSLLVFSNKPIFNPKISEFAPEICSDLVDDFYNSLESDFQKQLAHEFCFSDDKVSLLSDDQKKSLNVARASCRAKQRIFDIAFLNDWQYFCTLTFADRLCQSNVELAKKALSSWLRHSVRLSLPDFRYLIVPEYGGKYGNIHFHMLCSYIPVVDSGTVLCKGFSKPIKRSNVPAGVEVYSTVYNIPLWKAGFSTAVSIYKNDGALSMYLTKYMTKDQKKIFGKYYWSSQNLLRDPAVEYFNISEGTFELIDSREYHLPFSDEIGIKYISEISL